MKVISTKNKNAISDACNALRAGELVIYPTETCYGLAVDASNPSAVTKLLSYKGDRHRQVAIAVSSQEMATKYIDLNEIALNLYTNFLPGPITVISNSRNLLDPRLESASKTLGVRIPKHDFALELIQAYAKPITATSANTSGKKEPYSLQDWQKYTTHNKQSYVSLFLDHGKLDNRPTSTVVDTTLNSPEVLRQGELFLPDLPKQTYESKSTLETIHLSTQITKKYLNLTLKYPLIFALQGALGTGKTQLSKGVALALDINNNVNSPTYTLLKEYPYQTPKYGGIFYHLDTWRLSDANELESTLHLNTFLKSGNIISIEWAAKAKSSFEKYKEKCVIIYIEIKEKDPSTRIITSSVSTPEWS